MLNNAFVTAQIKDLWSKKAETIAKATDTMQRAMERFEKQFSKTANKMNSFNQEFSKAGSTVISFDKKFRQLENLKVVNLDNLVRGDLKKEINEVDKLNQKVAQLKARINERNTSYSLKEKYGIPLSGGIHETDALKRQIKELQAEERKQISGKPPEKPKASGSVLGGLITTATGVGFLRSAINNATAFDSALYDINRQLGENENLQDYVKFIEQYSLATGRSNVEVAQQTAELRKTLKAGEGLKEIGERMQLMTFAVNQLEVDSVTAAKSVEVIGKAFNLSTDGMKAFFSQANQMEDFYGALVTGGDLLEVIARMPITLMKNTKLMSKESTLMLATFAKANTALDASAVGYNLGKVLEGGTRARGGGIIASAEREGKTVEQYLFKIRDEFAKLKTLAEQNDFIEMVSGTNDLQAKDVFRSLLTELAKVDDAKINSFMEVQKQFKAGKVSAVDYKKAMDSLNEAERTYVARNAETVEAIKEFDRVMKLLGERHEATLGKMATAWRLISSAFGDSVLFPALRKLADGLEYVTPFITNFIKEYPAFIGLLTGSVAIAGLVGLVGAIGGLNLALGGVLLTMRAIATNPVFLAITAGTIAFDALRKIKDQKIFVNAEERQYIMEQERRKDLTMSQKAELIDQIRRDFKSGKTVEELRQKGLGGVTEFKTGGMSIGTAMPIPTPLTQPQLQPRGEMDIRVIVQGQAQVETDVKKQDNIFLNLFPTTTTRTI